METRLAASARISASWGSAGAVKFRSGSKSSNTERVGTEKGLQVGCASNGSGSAVEETEELGESGDWSEQAANTEEIEGEAEVVELEEALSSL